MTYNVHGCVGVDGRLDVGRIAGVIAQSRPDIVALQELDVGRVRSGRVDQAHEIANRLGMHFHFNSAFSVQEERYGDAILSRLPGRLIHKGSLPGLPRTRLERRGGLWMAVQIGSDIELQVINTHLGLIPLEQKKQVFALLGPEWIGHPDCCGPALLLGDFNAGSHYAAYRAIASRLRDVQRGRRGERLPGRTARTFPSRLPVLRIDHMFVSHELDVVDVHAAKSALARVASDHLPLVAELELRAI